MILSNPCYRTVKIAIVFQKTLRALAKVMEFFFSRITGYKDFTGRDDNGVMQYITDLKNFFHLCGCLMLHCFLKTSSIYSSFTETKGVQRRIMKIGSINVSLLSRQFYYTYETCKHCRFTKEKSFV